jgi:hypothetical protein
VTSSDLYPKDFPKALQLQSRVAVSVPFRRSQFVASVSTLLVLRLLRPSAAIGGSNALARQTQIKASR